jgi:predicted N-formylglutamate amidohydrolase
MIRWLLTCEHGGNCVPEPWQNYFVDADTALRSHRGWDRGALSTFNRLAPEIADAAFQSTTTRLLVDLNRSIGHRALFSEFTRRLSRSAKEEVLRRHYHAWRDPVIATIERWRRAGHVVIHVSVHSFARCLNGKLRDADIGLLYDPSHRLERALCLRWRRILRQTAADSLTRLNYPYKGTADGFTRALRQRFPTGYAGIELELNEANVGRGFAHMADEIVTSVRLLRCQAERLVSQETSERAD